MLILIIWNLILRLFLGVFLPLFDFFLVYFTAPRGKRQSSILFSCDRAAGRGSPQLMRETQGCSVTFQWRTNVVCPPKKMECKLAGQHQTYDLRTLSSLTEPWKFSNRDDSWVHTCCSVQFLFAPVMGCEWTIYHWQNSNGQYQHIFI